MPFAFSPVTGLNDVEQFPDEDPLIRQHIQTLLQQIPNYFQTVMNKLTVMTSRATNLTGDQVVALGFRPKFVKLHAVISNNLNYDSESSFDGTNHSTIFRYGNDGHVGTSATDIVLHSGVTAINSAVVTFTDTGLTLAWTATSTLPVGTIYVKIEAFG